MVYQTIHWGSERVVSDAQEGEMTNLPRKLAFFAFRTK